MFTRQRIVLMVSSLLLAGCDGLAGEPVPVSAATHGFSTFDCPEGSFRVDIPRGWRRSRDEREEARLHYHGVYATGPAGTTGVPPTLSVRYFAPDNGVFRSLDKYLDRQLRSGIVRLKGEKTTAVRDVLLAGRPGKTFTRESFAFVPPESLDTREVPVRREHYVVPHRDGFVVVVFSATTESFARWQPVWDRLLETLQLQPNGPTWIVEARVRGLAAEDVEASVTAPLEKALAKLPRVSPMVSITRDRRCRIRLTFPPGADVLHATAEVQTCLDAVREELPGRAEFSVVPAVDETTCLFVGLSLARASETSKDAAEALTAVARREVVPRVQRISGIGEVRLLATGPPSVQVIAADDRLVARDIAVGELLDAVRLFTQADPHGPMVLDDLQNTIVAPHNEDPVRVKDVADVRREAGRMPARRLWSKDAATPNRQGPPAVVLLVRSLETADPAAAFRAVERVLDELGDELPREMRLVRHVVGPSDIRVAHPATAPEDWLADLAVELLRLPGVAHVWRDDPAGEDAGFAASERPELVLATDRSPDAEVDRGLIVERIRAVPGTHVWGRVRIAIHGPDQERLLHAAGLVQDRLRTYSGASRPEVMSLDPTPRLKFDIDEDRAKHLGIEPDAIREVLEQIAESTALGRIPSPDGGDLDVVLTTEPDALVRLPVRAQGGRLVRLADVVTVSVHAGPSIIDRQEGQRGVVVAIDLGKGDPTTLKGELTSILSALRLPADCTWSIR